MAEMKKYKCTVDECPIYKKDKNGFANRCTAKTFKKNLKTWCEHNKKGEWKECKTKQF